MSTSTHFDEWLSHMDRHIHFNSNSKSNNSTSNNKGTSNSIYTQALQQSPAALSVLDWLVDNIQPNKNDKDKDNNPITNNTQVDTQITHIQSHMDRMEGQQALLLKELGAMERYRNVLEEEYRELNKDLDQLQMESTACRTDTITSIESTDSVLGHASSEEYRDGVHQLIGKCIAAQEKLLEVVSHTQLLSSGKENGLDKQALSEQIESRKVSLYRAEMQDLDSKLRYAINEAALLFVLEEKKKESKEDTENDKESLRNEMYTLEDEISSLRKEVQVLLHTAVSQQSNTFLYSDYSTKLPRQKQRIERDIHLIDSLCMQFCTLRLVNQFISVSRLAFKSSSTALSNIMDRIAISTERDTELNKKQKRDQDMANYSQQAIVSNAVVRDKEQFQVDLDNQQKVEELCMSSYFSLMEKLKKRNEEIWEQMSVERVTFREKKMLMMTLQNMDEGVNGMAKTLASFRQEYSDFCEEVGGLSKERMFLREMFVHYYTNMAEIQDEISKLERF